MNRGIEQDQGASSPSAPTALAPLRGQAPSGLEQSRSSTGAALLALAERCEKAAGPDRDLDFHIAIQIGWHPAGIDPRTFAAAPALYVSRVYRYTASLDAAMTLVPEGWDWSAGTETLEGFPPGNASMWPQEQPFPVEMDICSTEAATPALALCNAALKARAASVGRNAKRHDPAEGRGPQDEHAVGSEADETPKGASQ